MGWQKDNIREMANEDELERRLRDMETARTAANDANVQQQNALAQKRANINANANNIRNAANAAMASKNPYATGMGGAIKAADKITGGKSSEALGKALEKDFRKRPFGGLAQKASNKLSESGASDAIGSAASMKNGSGSGDKSKDKQIESSSSVEGTTSFLPKSGLGFTILVFCACCCCALVLFTAIISAVYEIRVDSVILGAMSSEDRELVQDVINSIASNDSLGMGYTDQDKYAKRFEVLGNNFTSEIECEKEDCSDRPEVRYYLKVADVALRYKNKYHINLDWVLLNATMMYSDVDEEATMERSLHDYNLDDVENYDILMDLDWDYDYKKIPGYSYLSPHDFRYDLQILAKNMVRKTTTQTCTKIVENEDGTYSTIVTKSQTDIDIEAEYFEPGAQYYLQCDSGETYHISNDYKYDAEKYDEFLLEYLERKYYLPSGVDPITGETDMTPSEATGDYIFPLPDGSTSCRSSAYGPRRHPITGKYNDHSGDDYPAAAGTPVYAVKDGVVTAAGTGCKVGDTGCYGGMGNYVIIDHGNGITSVYMHASKVFVSSGTHVKQGDVIMAVGTTGSSTGNHLHITFKKNGVKTNPANYIGALRMCS